MNPVFEALSLMTPFDIDIPKRRIGPNTDGGYVFADRIDPSQAIVSYGISTEYRFDRLMAEAGHKVYMFDHTIDGIDRAHANMMWHKEGVAGLSSPPDRLYSIEDHLVRHDILGDRLILKMDVEGAEFDSLGLCPDETLSRFEQIVLEVHSLVLLNDREFRDRCVAMLRRINRHFTLFHVHANNCDGPDGIRIVAGFPVSNLLELSYIKTSAVTRSASRTLYPTAFDYPNVPAKDKLLWFYPFLPTLAKTEDFAVCEDRVALVAAQHALHIQQTQHVALLRAENVCRWGVNIALGKPATQSSFSDFSGPDDAQGAVNGRITGEFGFHTAEEYKPWWQVDLLETTALSQVIVFNRIGPAAERACSFVLKLGDESGVFRQVYAQEGRAFGGQDGKPARIPLDGARARYVRIELTTTDYLHLDEVEVYAA